MAELEQRLARLRAINDAVRASDPNLASEGRDTAQSSLPSVPALEALSAESSIENEIGLESIILRQTRPVLAIQHNETKLDFADQTDSEIWRQRLENAKAPLSAAIRAVGRIELKGAHLDWVGTGWLVAENVLVTNRHVANEFAAHKGDGFTFKPGSGGLIAASVDFLQEIGNSDTLVFELVKPLHIEDPPGPDIAFFEIKATSGDLKLARPIPLADQARAAPFVATIGYPAYDSRIPEPDLMEKIYGRIYNKKRLAPGAVTVVEARELQHNCTTLGGNSGSTVIDLDSGKALGLHFSGTFLTTNYAVRCDVVSRILADVQAGRRSSRVEAKLPKPPASVVAQRPRPARASPTGATFTIPLTVTVSLGDQPRLLSAQAPLRASAADTGGDEAGVEALIEDYRDREGYVPSFLGDGKAFKLDLPEVERSADDVLTYNLGGKDEMELRYEHYSVVMSRSRRMCFFSAVNIDGGQSKKSKRVSWKWDPRIPKTQQIMNECYGSPPKFSRGHMTRREDPGWGTAATAKRGNEDSMHVTNTTPQMQAFNAPIWLALEDYALDHTKEDEMKVSVFTGPYFEDDDPTMYGVRIPRAFWKIIAFIHDDTGKLCATGYEMNQGQSLQPEEEFVFGAFTSPQLSVATQVPIRSIEAKSGISFGRLATIDPLARATEALATDTPAPLVSLEQIRFLP